MMRIEEVFFLVTSVATRNATAQTCICFIAADEMAEEYNRRMYKVAEEFQGYDDFAVVVQPALTAFDVAKYKQAYFSGIDW
jgi:hypothetical protein